LAAKPQYRPSTLGYQRCLTHKPQAVILETPDKKTDGQAGSLLQGDFFDFQKQNTLFEQTVAWAVQSLN